MRSKRWWLSLGLVSSIGLLTACQPGGFQMETPSWTSQLDDAAQNGARIYFTATSQRASAITSTGDLSLGAGMMGSGGYGGALSCASCHGANGEGGLHLMHMRVMNAPGISYAELSAMSELKDRQRPYDIDDFRQTVTFGVHPDGEKLELDMPRWKMSDQDLKDLFAFLQALPH